MQQLKEVTQSFLESLQAKLDCEIQFVPSSEKPPAFLTKDSLFFEEGKMGIPFFFQEDFYGCFFISGKHLNDKSFKLLEILIREGFNYFFERFGNYFYFQYLLSKKEDHLEDSNVIPFSKKTDHFLSHLMKESQVLFVSGESKEKTLHSAICIHNLTPNLAFINLMSLMKKERFFTVWSKISLTTLFVPDWMSCEDWQKQQIKDFISLSNSPLPSKIIIGLQGESSEWKIF